MKQSLSEFDEKLLVNEPFAVKAYKRAINRGVSLPLDEALRLEVDEYDRVAQ
jgi:hypothetical protein